MNRCIQKFVLLLAFGAAFPVLAQDKSQVDADGCFEYDVVCHAAHKREKAAEAAVLQGTVEGDMITVPVDGKRLPPQDPCKADPACQHGTPPSPGPEVNVLPPTQNGPGAGNMAAAQAAANTDTKNTCETGQQVPEPNPHGPNPVIFATGEKFLHEQDFASASYYGLHLTRTYRSKQAVGTLFGPNWVTDMETPPLQGINGCSIAGQYGGCGPSSVTMFGDDGAANNFNFWHQNGNQYVYQGSAGGWLIYIPGSQWVYQKTQNDIYLYNLAGYITSFHSSVTGVSYTYTYLPQTNRLSKITNAVGQSITFTWGSNNRVASVTDQNGNIWTYSYNGNGMLTRVLSPGASGDSREYYYEDSRPTLLTGVATNGVRYSTYSYYPDGRVQRSGRTNGEKVDNFTYGTNTTTLTNEMGASSTFTFTSIGGSLKLTSISRATTATCSAAAAATSYDGWGFPNLTTSWEGTQTSYQFDGTGHLLQSTFAPGTTSSNTTVNTWSGDLITAIEHRDATNTAYTRITYTYDKNSSGQTINRVLATATADLVSGATLQETNSYSFYANGTIASRVTTISLPEGPATRTTSYDTLGNVATVTNSIGQQVSWSNYNGFGQPGHYVDFVGVATDYIYDPAGNLTTATRHLSSGDQVTAYTYDHHHNVTSIGSPDGNIARYQYNSAERLEYVGNAQNEFVHTALDLTNNSVTQSADRKVPSWNGSTLTSSLSRALKKWSSPPDFVAQSANFSGWNPHPA